MGQACALLGIKKATMYSLVCRKEIPHLRISGRMVRFHPEELKAWVEARSVKDRRYVQPNDC